MASLSPTQILERRRQLLLDHDTDGFAGLFAADGVIEMPFAGPGLPAKLSGQQAIREYAQRTEAAPIRIDDLQDTAVYQTSDPEVVVVEQLSKVTVTSTGQQVATASIKVIRIRDGKIVLFRDYVNSPGLEALLRD
jgi:uncharacterized protein